jgi:hypothetical protein
VNAAHALEKLPYISACLGNGSLSLDKVVELTRFAKPEDEEKLVRWARRTTPGGIRKRADQLARVALEKVRDAHEARFFTSWWDEASASLRFEGMLPADAGARLSRAVERIASQLPEAPQGEARLTMEQKRADALTELASAHIASDKDPDRATVMVHVDAEDLRTGKGNAELAGSLPIHLDTARRLCCGSRLQLVVEGKDGVLGAGDVIDGIPHSLRRQVSRRDHYCCTFPGCHRKVRLVPHHIEHDALEGPTDLFNLTSLCGLHHWYMHEGKWSVTRTPDGELIFFRPSGRRYDPGPAPPDRDAIPESSRPTEQMLIEARSYSPLLAYALIV